ncbi:hypothetical protein ACJ41O_001106 [Fusarium nematophilum]
MTILVGKPLDWAITATAGSGFLLFGYDQGVMSGLLTGYAFTRTFPEIDTTNGGGGSSSLQGTVVAIYEIGCFFGAIFCLLAGERLGRRRCIMIGCVVLSIGAALQAASFGIPQMIVGRIVAGLGNGMNTSTIPVWHSELMKPKNRGRGLAVELAINIFGVMLSYWVDYGMSYVNNDAQFRFPLALQILFAIMTFAGILVLPESPRWLIAHDRHDEAREILWAVRRDAASIGKDDPSVSRNMAEIQDAIREEREAAQAGSFRAMLKNGEQKFLYRTLLGIGGQFAQQLSGINLITYASQPGPGIVAIVMLFLFNFFFAVGLLAIPWLLPAEYAPLAIRTRAAALATASNWIFTFLVVEITPVSIKSIGWKTYIYFSIFNFAFLPMFYFFYPETRMLSLEQIDKLFTGDRIMLHWDRSMGVPGEAPEKNSDGETAGVEHEEKTLKETKMESE